MVLCFGKCGKPTANTAFVAITDIVQFVCLAGYEIIFKHDSRITTEILKSVLVWLYIIGIFVSILLLVGTATNFIPCYVVHIVFTLIFTVVVPFQLFRGNIFETSTAFDIFTWIGGLLLLIAFNIFAIVVVVNGIKYLRQQSKKEEKEINYSTSIVKDEIA
ncbi:unnamed protein product [Bursaphelenchus okinawaensis]|uniref:Uncharacterized protein n=1 Tax=Bursaphelenchus okinawaensis TaxID=465554 RepID=A0A811KTY9_9BILA|nr:unnamed protein product [Bursaphelenchus okinawaensis]CAG9112124.1 unnamed protein product [Bursaphelenchus okinawaensis]